MKRITIPYFPIGLKYATPLLFGAGIYLGVIGYPIWMVPLFLLGAMILKTEYVTEIDLKKKEYRDFISLLGIPLDEERTSFTTLNKIVITKEEHSQMLNSRSRSRQLDWTSFIGTLLIDDNKTLELLNRTEKRELIKGLKEFAEFMNLDIEDQTTKQHFKIDQTKY